MGNEYTKKQITDFLDRAIDNAKNPDLREKIRRERQKKAQKVSKRYGF